jgi:hypothetical protein
LSDDLQVAGYTFDVDGENAWFTVRCDACGSSFGAHAAGACRTERVSHAPGCPQAPAVDAGVPEFLRK